LIAWSTYTTFLGNKSYRRRRRPKSDQWQEAIVNLRGRNETHTITYFFFLEEQS
jgi:hypothetical protein